MSDRHLNLDWQTRIDLHRELSLLADPDPRKIIRSPDPHATSLVFEVLRKNQDWLPSGIVADSRGHRIDVIEAMLDPSILGELRDVYKSERLFAMVEKIGTISDFIVLDHSIKLELDSSEKSSLRLRAFVSGIGMLTLGDHDVRYLATYDPPYCEAGRIIS